MKKFVSFLALALTTLVFFSSCFQKYREPEADDDGIGVSAASKWDWQGTAPFSAILGGEVRNTPANSKIEKIISNKLGLFYGTITEPTNSGSTQTSRVYAIMIEQNLKPGIHVSIGDQNMINFNFMYTPVQEILPGKPLKVFGTHKLVLKLIRNDEQVVEGYFYGKIRNTQNTTEIMEVKDAYFRIEKSGAIVAN